MVMAGVALELIEPVPVPVGVNTDVTGVRAPPVGARILGANVPLSDAEIGVTVALAGQAPPVGVNVTDTGELSGPAVPDKDVR